MPSTQLEDGFVSCRLDNVNDSACVLLLTETFKHQIVAGRLLILYEVVLVRLPFVLGFNH